MSTITASEKRQQLGQFLTSESMACFMASLFERPPRDLNLLDAGAGAGVLSAMLIRKLCRAEERPQRITVTAYELDRAMIASLELTYARCKAECLRPRIEFWSEVENIDFTEAALLLIRGDLFTTFQTPFNTAILNPKP